jgi:hypothetical protein
MALYAPSVIEDIRDRLPVSQIVAQRVAIKRAGRIWRGLCPFHQEKTPSFTCDDQRQTYHLLWMRSAWRCFLLLAAHERRNLH